MNACSLRTIRLDSSATRKEEGALVLVSGDRRPAGKGVVIVVIIVAAMIMIILG